MNLHDDEVESPWEIILYYIKSMLAGLGMVVFAFAVAYFTVWK